MFQRVGESTDVVRKEMYDFETAGGDRIALRPEGTASIVRAFVEHHPTTPWKAWYVAPKFRYERPQAGRYRQHHQLGVEAIGTDDPDVDVEVIALLWGFYGALGLRRLRLQLNSLGDRECRPAYFERAARRISRRTPPTSVRRARETLSLNPLRVLDSKREEDRAVITGAPHMVDHLCAGCDAHFARVQSGLEAARRSIRARTATRARPRLLHPHDVRVRRRCARVGAERRRWRRALRRARRAARRARDARHRLRRGHRAHPARVRRRGRVRGVRREHSTCSSSTPLVATRRGGITHALRAAGIRADRAFDGRSMKAQMKAADRSGARLALIIGADEVAAGTVTVRDMREGHDQQAVARDQIIDHVRKASRMTLRIPTTAARCAPTTSARRSRSAAGSRAGASTASTSRSSTCATTPASCSAWSTARTTCATSTSSASTGTVRRRPEGTVNPELPTGEVEIGDCTVEVLNAAEPPPFPVDDRVEADENVRLRHRYVDLRRDPHAAQPARAGRGQHRHPRARWSGRASSRSRRRC